MCDMRHMCVMNCYSATTEAALKYIACSAESCMTAFLLRKIAAANVQCATCVRHQVPQNDITATICHVRGGIRRLCSCQTADGSLAHLCCLSLIAKPVSRMSHRIKASAAAVLCFLSHGHEAKLVVEHLHTAHACEQFPSSRSQIHERNISTPLKANGPMPVSQLPKGRH